MTGIYGGTRIRPGGSNRRRCGETDLDLIWFAIARMFVRFERGDSEEARDSGGRLPMWPDGSASRSDDWIRLGQARTGEAEEILDSGFLGPQRISPRGSFIRSSDNGGR